MPTATQGWSIQQVGENAMLVRCDYKHSRDAASALLTAHRGKIVRGSVFILKLAGGVTMESFSQAFAFAADRQHALTEYFPVQAVYVPEHNGYKIVLNANRHAEYKLGDIIP